MDDLGGELRSGLHLELVTGIEPLFRLLPLEQVLVAPADVLVDLRPKPLDLVLVPQEPRDVLAGMLTGFGREEPEASEDLHPDAPPEPVRIGFHDPPKHGIQVLAR